MKYEQHCLDDYRNKIIDGVDAAAQGVHANHQSIVLDWYWDSKLDDFDMILEVLTRELRKEIRDKSLT